MDTWSAFAMGETHRNNPLMVFDWIKAAKLIVENPEVTIEAGLRGDWEYTGGVIWQDGKPVKEYVYLASTWAKPEIEIDGDREDCWIYQAESPNEEWSSSTHYPPEARRILIEAFGEDIFKSL